MDLGPHLVDQALALFGAPSSLTASVRRDREGTGIEDAFDLWLAYDGFHALLRSTMIAADASARFLLHGTYGSYRKFGVDPQELSRLLRECARCDPRYGAACRHGEGCTALAAPA